MSLFMPFPWISGAKSSHQPPQQASASLAALGVPEGDTELAARLTEAAAAGKVWTEDLVVECQLTQFPPYGTTFKQQQQSATNLVGTDDDVDDEQDNSNDGDGSYRRTGGPNNHATNAPPTDPSPHWLMGSWMSSSGGGASNAAWNASGDASVTTSARTRLMDESDEPTTKNGGTEATPTLGSAAKTTEWDDEEQRLWKKKWTPSNNAPSNNNGTIPAQRAQPQQQPQPLQSTSVRGKPWLLYRTPLVSWPRPDYTSTSTTASVADPDRETTPADSLPGKPDASLAAERDVASPEHVVETTLAALATVRRSSPPQSSSSTSSLSPVLTNRTLVSSTAVPPPAPSINNTSNHAAVTPVLSLTSRTTTRENDEDRQHWMPDQLCKQCYACETPFTVFRRRHHCRLCGQVFCNACSANFVPTDVALGTGHSTSTNSLTTTTGGVAMNTTGLATASETSSMVNRPTVRVCQMCYEHATRRQSTSGSTIGAVNTSTSSITTTATALNSNKAESQTEVSYYNTGSTRPNSHGGGEDYHPPSSPFTARRKEYPSTSNNTDNSVATSTTLVDARVERDRLREGNALMGRVAAEHLERLARELLRLRAPLLWQQTAAAASTTRALNDHNRKLDHNIISSVPNNQDLLLRAWINQLLSLATRCCATVTPNVKKGDLLDLRPYVKIKVIPGGSYRDCAYMSGVVFRKTVSHKRMAREVPNPRIMLLSGGIEFTRMENRMASLETLFEQEEKYMEILVGKILKLKPDVLLVGRSVSRKAQELLLKAGVVLVRHVKSKLLNRISRQTGATVISSTDLIMNQFAESVLGKCRRFRLVTFRDNEAWTDGGGYDDDADEKDDPATPLEEKKSPCVTTSNTVTGKKSEVANKANTRAQKSIKTLLADPTLSHSERQAALAANRLGEDVLDGAEAVKTGLAKRGVANTYIMLEGCPKELGCTVVLRGANRATLKQVKSVFRFLANAAYNLRLETTYLKERGARIRPDFQVVPANIYSTSMCVNYGQPPDGRKVRPWNGGNSESSQRLVDAGGELSALDHQSILITSVWMTEKTQCCPAEVKGICYYSMQDVALGQFLRDSCFNLSLKCQNPNCKKSVLDHSLSFVHNDGLINIMVEEMEDPLPSSEPPKEEEDDVQSEEDDENNVDRPIATWTYCQRCRKVVTPLTYISDNTWKFSFGKFLEVFFYNRDAILNAPGHGCSCNLQSNATLYFGCGKLAARFTYEKVAPFGVFVRKTLPLDVMFHRKEAMRRLGVISVESSNLFVAFDKHIEKITREARSLFHSAVNRPEHLQTVLSELNRIGSEVDHAAKTLQEKIASISETYRNSDDCSLKLFQFPLFASRYLFNLTWAWNEKLSAAGQAITAMKKIAASGSHRADGALGTNTSNSGDPLNEELSEGMKRLRQLIDHYARYNVTDISQVLPLVPGGNEIAQEVEYDEEFDDPETAIDFSDGVDADVLASRRRLSSKQSSSVSERSKTPNGSKRLTKALGTRRSLTHESSSINAPPKPPPGGAGAVKSALTRFFNRGGREYDRYIVNLGIFAEGRPRLPLGVDGLVIPVFDEQLSTIIAYSLASMEYSKQFKHFTRAEGLAAGMDGDPTERYRKSGSEKPDLDAGVGEESEKQGIFPREKPNAASHVPQSALAPGAGSINDDVKGTERRMLNRNKSHIKHTFRDVDEKGTVICKFVCTTYWATQFHAVRQGFLCNKTGQPERPENQNIEQNYIESLSSAYSWAASGGKSGASFARTSDDRFVIKCISRTELQMFLDCAPAYFEYLSKAFFHGLPTVLCKIVGVYQIGVHNRETGKRSMEQVAVMQNIFYNKTITRVFDLKGSLRGRFTARVESAKEETQLDTPYPERWSENPLNRPTPGSQLSDNNSIVDLESVEGSQKRPGKDSQAGPSVLLDGDFLEFTMGRPMPLTDRAKAVFQMSILNDTLFLSIINVLDYSIVVGVDEESMELVVGIIDFMRQYDILKQMERVGKSLPMVVGSEAPTIIQPPLYKARFTNAMERYFMTVPSKWTTI